MRRKKKLTVDIIPNIRIEEMAAEGKCLARHENLVIFVKDAAPGDVVDLKVTKQKKNFLEAYPVKFHEYSDLRVEPFCEHFGVCGGCKWQHIGYETQLYYKQKQVTDNLERIGKINIKGLEPIKASDKTTYYRNKLEYTFSNNIWLTAAQIQSESQYNRDGLGFHIPGRFDKILDIKHCYLQPEPTNNIRLAVRQYAKEHGLVFFNMVRMEGYLRNLIVRTANTGEVMVVLQVNYEAPEIIGGLMEYLKNAFPEITSLNYVVNGKGNETFHDLEVICYSGQPYIHEEMEGLQFRIGPKSFYQTNANQAYELYKITREFAQLTGSEVVYDLYTGAGTIANFVARHCKEVIGVEYVDSAIIDAKLNSELNNITNTKFFAGDMREVLNDDFIAAHGRPDVIITDPPRAGMHADVIQKLNELRARRIVYVSCNPATQARDIDLLTDNYEVTRIRPVDMFPQTHHVENVLVLELKNN